MTQTQNWTPKVDRPEGESPLKRFRGKLDSWARRDWAPAEGQTGKARIYIDFSFTDVEVIEATEPYPFPIAKVSVGYADPSTSRGQTKWAALSESIRVITKEVPGIEPGQELNWMVGRVQEWYVGTTELRVGPNDSNAEWHNAQSNCWKVATIDGGAEAQSAGDILGYVAKLADGKLEQDFYAALYTDQGVKSHPKIIEQATKRELIPVLTNAGLLTRTEDGVLHAVNGAAV